MGLFLSADLIDWRTIVPGTFAVHAAIDLADDQLGRLSCRLVRRVAI